MTTRSEFTSRGLPLGSNTSNMTYLYGISDFFASMFEDTETVNLFLEATAFQASEIYSKFLQLTSSLSLKDIQLRTGKSIQLVILNSGNAIAGHPYAYSITDPLVASRFVSNRPLLPTTSMENGVDFRIEETATGANVYFSRDISNVGFPTRSLSDGTLEYALWFVDSELDEKAVSNYFGDIIGISESQSTTTFKNFVYGLYYIYTHGPNLELMRKGLNLSLGLPLARGTETVIEIRSYLSTDQYLVITDANQYIVPYGLAPVVSVGDVLTVSQEIAQWVEIKDFNHDGAWWINMMIPPTVIPSLPPTQANRYATSGSQFDYLMRTYLSTHTFLVNVKVSSFKSDQNFSQISDIINTVKPAYTRAIYVWTVTTEDENLSLQEDFEAYALHRMCEFLNVPIEKFYRGNSLDPLFRGCPYFMRNTTPDYVNKLAGGDAYVNGPPAYFRDGPRNGFVNYIKQYRANTSVERSWLRALMSRDCSSSRMNRSFVNFCRSSNAASDATFSYSGQPAKNWIYKYWGISDMKRIVPLYLTTQTDIATKFTSAGIPIPGQNLWVFDFSGTGPITQAINQLPINSGLPTDPTSLLISNFSLFFFRGADIQYLGPVIPPSGYSTFAPTSADIQAGDFLLGVRIDDTVVGVYWITSNVGPQNTWRNMPSSDQLSISMTLRMARKMGVTGSSLYHTRSFATTSGGSVVTNLFYDSINPAPLTINRSGVIINHTMELK